MRRVCRTRQCGRAVDLILESFVFLLIGLQLPSVVNGLQGYSTSIVVWASVAVLVTVVVVRIALGVPVHVRYRAGCRRVFERGSRRFRRGRVFVVSWAGMRGVVSLAAAFAIPLTVNSGEGLPGAVADPVPDVCRRGRHAVAARPDVAVGDPCPRRAGGRRAVRRSRRGGRSGQGCTGRCGAAGRIGRSRRRRRPLRSAIVPRTSCEAGTPTARTRRGSDWDAATRIWGRARRTPSARCASR